MTNEELLREIDWLPLEARRMIEDFVAFLRQRYAPVPHVESKVTSDLADEEFIGMWKDREDMRDSTAWVRHIRQSHLRANAIILDLN